MPISNDVDPPFPRLPTGKLLQVSARSKLVAVASEIERRYGPPKATVAQPDSILKSAAVKLVRSRGNLASLTHRERKAAVELCWVARDGWKPDRAFAREWSHWAENNWNTGVGTSRIAVSYVRNYDSESEATNLIGAWLGSRLGEVRGRFGEVFRHYGLHDGTAAVPRIANSLAWGNREFFAGIDADAKSSAVFKGSGFLIAVLADYGRRCERNTIAEVPEISKLLVDHIGEAGLGVRSSQRARDAARISTVVGIVAWATRIGSQKATDRAIDVCLWLAGDPRHEKGPWRDIPAKTVDTVHGWLTARTIENMFLVIDTLKTDHPDQVASRLAFWRAYLPHIRKAYLLCARGAKPIADRLNERYGRLDSSDSLHCGLLMEIVGPRGDRMSALEINKNASALFWKPNSQSRAPEFYDQSPYDRQSYLHACDKRIYHNGNWQRTFADFIEAETGIRRL